MRKLYRYAFVALMAFVVTGCPAKASASTPAAFEFAAPTVAGDTLTVSAPCVAVAPTVTCRFTEVKDSVAGVTLVASRDVAVGGNLTVAYVCPAPLANVVITAKAFGVTSGGTVTTGFRSGRGTFTCPDEIPNVPGAFTITITVSP